MAEHRIFNFPDKYMCDLVSHQSVNVASERGDKSGATRGKLCRTRSPGRRVAPNLPTLIHPLPTLRRTGPAANRERLRRNNNIIFVS